MAEFVNASSALPSLRSDYAKRCTWLLELLCSKLGNREQAKRIARRSMSRWSMGLAGMEGPSSCAKAVVRAGGSALHGNGRALQLVFDDGTHLQIVCASAVDMQFAGAERRIHPGTVPGNRTIARRVSTSSWNGAKLCPGLPTTAHSETCGRS